MCFSILLFLYYVYHTVINYTLNAFIDTFNTPSGFQLLTTINPELKNELNEDEIVLEFGEKVDDYKIAVPSDSRFIVIRNLHFAMKFIKWTMTGNDFQKTRDLITKIDRRSLLTFGEATLEKTDLTVRNPLFENSRLIWTDTVTAQIKFTTLNYSIFNGEYVQPTPLVRKINVPLLFQLLNPKTMSPMIDIKELISRIEQFCSNSQNINMNFTTDYDQITWTKTTAIAYATYSKQDAQPFISNFC
jgi:hypothetical protein